MTTALARRTIKATTLVVLAAMLAPGVAGAVVLPERGPIPIDRPMVEVGDPIVIAHQKREVVRISTTEQEIPDARRDVRVVGSNFLPAADESIDFTLASNSQLSAVTNAEHFVMAMVTLLFERSDEQQPLQVAATTN